MLNRLKTRKEACPELLAYLPPNLPDELQNKLLDLLEPLGVDVREWRTQTMGVIKFMRKVDKEWDEQEGWFRPCEEYRKDEEWIVHWLPVDEFVDLTCNDQTGLKLQFHIERLKKTIPGAKIVIILEGLTALLTRVKKAVANAHDAAAREIGGLEGARRNRNQELLDIDEEVIQNELIKIQLNYEIRIVHTSSTTESAEWITILATDIASIPYRFRLMDIYANKRWSQMLLDRSICMEKGQVKSGTNAADTFHKMLQHVARVTPHIADAITARYKSVHSLIEGFRQGGPYILEDLDVGPPCIDAMLTV